MTNFNFNVGDKVICLTELSLWNNVFHFKKFEDHFIKTVAHANERYFSLGYDINENASRFEYERQYFYNQHDGSWCDYSLNPHVITKLYHLERDRGIITAHMNKLFDIAFKEAEKADNSEIEKIELEIKRLQAKVQAIKDGKRPSIEPTISQRDFLNYRKNNILKQLA